MEKSRVKAAVVQAAKHTLKSLGDKAQDPLIHIPEEKYPLPLSTYIISEMGKYLVEILGDEE